MTSSIHIDSNVEEGNNPRKSSQQSENKCHSSIEQNFRKHDNKSSKGLKRASRALSRILRHTAIKSGLQMRKDGYVSVSELQKLNLFKELTIEDFKTIVKDDNKTRFHLFEDADEWMIRANQGHSIPNIQIDMELVTSPLDTVVHGTYQKALDSILKKGLSKMSRQHIHLAIGLPNDKSVISGMRTTSEIIIFIDMKLAMEDGIVFYKSLNGVILTEGLNGHLSTKYFAKIINRITGEEINIS